MSGPSIESIIRNLTNNPEHALALLEYSYSNVFDYCVNAMTSEDVERSHAQKIVLKSYLRELEGKLVQ